jgi:hypothetical protein
VPVPVPPLVLVPAVTVPVPPPPPGCVVVALGVEEVPPAPEEPLCVTFALLLGREDELLRTLEPLFETARAGALAGFDATARAARRAAAGFGFGFGGAAFGFGFGFAFGGTFSAGGAWAGATLTTLSGVGFALAAGRRMACDAVRDFVDDPTANAIANAARAPATASSNIRRFGGFWNATEGSGASPSPVAEPTPTEFFLSRRCQSPG